MRCGCSVCGSYMVQSEKGLDSTCVCPTCFHKCNACMGTQQTPLQPDDLKRQIALRRSMEYDGSIDPDLADPMQENDSGDWRKHL